MIEKTIHTKRESNLRRRAEEKVKTDRVSGLNELSAEEARRLVHELQVHQIELEMQNEELQRIQEEIETARARYFDLYDLAPVGYLTVSEKGIIMEANLTMANLLGMNKAGLVKQGMTRFIYSEDQDIYYHHRRQLSETGSPQVCVMRMLHRDGSYIWARLETALTNDNEVGQPVCRIALSDITDYKRLEFKEEELQIQLQHSQKMEAVGVLAGGIAHEFNNLLQTINGYTQILLFDKTEDDSEYSNLQAIYEAGSRAAQLVRQLLLFSRKLELQSRPVNINQEVELALRILERTIPKMIDVRVHLADHLWMVKADPLRVQQVLIDLGSNAADAMPEGGNLFLETECVFLNEEYARTHPGVQPGKYVLLTVSDTGQGMDGKTTGKIFDPFFTTKKVGQGTGLGLASVYGIIKSHGGYIDCDSQLGQGTTFKIYWPALEPDEATESKSPIIQLNLGGKETILVVDDEVYIRDFVAKALQKFSYKVLTASSGEEALKLYPDKIAEIDLVILDIGMPGMGGHRCLRELVKIDPEAKVLIASGYSIDEQVKKTLEAGAAGYIDKPYKLVDLLEKIRNILDRKG